MKETVHDTTSLTIYDFQQENTYGGGSMQWEVTPSLSKKNKTGISLNRPGGFVVATNTQKVDPNAYSKVSVLGAQSKPTNIPLPKSFQKTSGSGIHRAKETKKNNIRFMF